MGIALVLAVAVVANAEYRAVAVLEQDSTASRLAYPAGLAADRRAGELHVVDSGKGQVVTYAEDLFPVAVAGAGTSKAAIHGVGYGGGRLYLCLGSTAANPQGSVRVLNGAYLPERELRPRDFAGHEKFVPVRCAVAADGRLWVVGLTGRVVILRSDGTFCQEVLLRDGTRARGKAPPVVDLAATDDGRVFLLSEALGRVFVLGADTEPRYAFGEKGSNRGKLARPKGLAVDVARQRVFVVDYLRHTVNVYREDGLWLEDFGGKGQGRGWLFYPSAVCVDGRGRVAVADTFNHRVQLFQQQAEREIGAPRSEDGGAG